MRSIVRNIASNLWNPTSSSEQGWALELKWVTIAEYSFPPSLKGWY
jgi:hypothetical protein